MLKKLLAVFTLIFSLLIFAPSVLASTLYLSSESTNMSQGSIVSVTVGLNTQDESINAVSAYLSYPTDKLEVVSITYTDSFPIAAEESYEGGEIKISRGDISGVAGNVNIATIDFRAKAQGSATVSFIEGSGAARTSDSSDSLNLAESTGDTFSIKTILAAVSVTQIDQESPDILENILGFYF
jgi:hypothetical protein